MVLLALESETGAVLTYRLAKSQITVGSSSRNDVVVRSPGVAERHLVMHRNGDLFTFVTVDRQSVVLNGERRSRGVLNPGDRVRIGPMTLIFRSGDASGLDDAPDGATARRGHVVGAVDSGDQIVFLADPAGFAATRSRLVEVLAAPRSDSFQRVVALTREALPGVEVAILVADESGRTAALASVWNGDLPRFSPAALGDVLTPGRYAQIVDGGGAAVVVPVVTPERELVGFLAARPPGALGNEGIGLLGEEARLLGMRWRDIGREGAALAGWEAEARRRLEERIPGNSQAVQGLRAGMLEAAAGDEPVLVCGRDGVGRTETARALATIGPSPAATVVVVDGGDRDVESMRRELFGPSGHPSLAEGVEGAVGRASGGVLILRNADRLPPSLQAELAGLISAQHRGAPGAATVRWMVTCGEDPLALVQQGKLASALFLVVSRPMLRVPPLAERREDLPFLVARLLANEAAEQHKTLRGITLECLNTLVARSFPGEMSELVGEINRLVTATPDGEMVRCEGLEGGTAQPEGRGGAAPTDPNGLLASDNLKEVVPRVEQLIIDRVMRRVKGNQSKGARTLGISRGALIAKLKEYSVPDYRFLRRKKARG